MAAESAAGLESLRREAASCRACPLWKDATQTVFGEGPADAEIMFVGDQPGDREDVRGRPFVGPAGLLLDKALNEAGIDRTRVYVTNAVKHFKFEPRGKRRLHKRPNAGEIKVCRNWLIGEIETIAPRLVVAFGATAAQSLAGRPIPVQSNRGAVLDLPADFGSSSPFIPPRSCACAVKRRSVQDTTASSTTCGRSSKSPLRRRSRRDPTSAPVRGIAWLPRPALAGRDPMRRRALRGL
jgi:uracil-DNA glycosylase family protein